MVHAYHGALRAVRTKSGDIAVVFTPDQAQKYLDGQCSDGAVIRVDVAIEQAIRAVIAPTDRGDCDVSE